MTTQKQLNLIKEYQQTIEKLSLIRKAAADHQLNNNFSQAAHEAITKEYEKDVEYLSKKASMFKVMLERSFGALGCYELIKGGR